MNGMKRTARLFAGLSVALLGAGAIGCSSGGSSSSEDQIASYARLISNGPELTQRSSAWVCRLTDYTVDDRASTTTSVVFRFFDDGQMIIGYGDDETLARWDLGIMRLASNEYDSVILDTPVTARYLPTRADEHDFDSVDVSVYIGTPSPISGRSGQMRLNIHRTSPPRAGAARAETVLDGDEIVGGGGCYFYESDGRSLDWPNFGGFGPRAPYTPFFNPDNLDLVLNDSGQYFEAGSDEQAAGFDPYGREPDSEPMAQPDDDDSEPTTPSRPETVSPEPEPEPEPATPSGNAQVLGDLQDDIKAIWYIADRGDVVALVNDLSSAFYSVIEFEDGSATTDGTFLSEFGERSSRREQPERWGEARVQNGVFGFKLEGERSWLEPEAAFQTEFRPRGTLLTGCFSSSFGSIGGPTTSISFRSLCTDNQGRFAFDSTTAASGDAGGGAVSSNARGDYVIDERAIRFEFDNGDVQERLFGMLFDEGFVDVIVLGSSVLRADE